MIKYGLIFVGGIATGLLIAKLYARAQVNTAIHDGLSKFGLGGGEIEHLVSDIVVPRVVG